MSKSKGWGRQKHDCLQPGGRSCHERQKSSGTGRSPPGGFDQDAGPVQTPRSAPDPCQQHERCCGRVAGPRPLGSHAPPGGI